jgi:hypothetical protein
MYKLEIEINEYSFGEEESVTIKTFDIDKANIIAKFIEFQQDHGWCVEYDVTAEYAAMQCDEEVAEVEEEEEEEEEYEIGDWYYAEDGTVWERIE